MSQQNSFECRSCGIIESEESGACEGFTCEECIAGLEDNLRDVEARKEEIINQHIDHEDLEESGVKEIQIRGYMRKYWDFNKSEYLEFAYLNEDFSEFLLTTALNTLAGWNDPQDKSAYKELEELGLTPIQKFKLQIRRLLQK